MVFETIGATATGAGKVNVVEMMAAFTAAHAVFLDARTVVYLVKDVMFGKKPKSTEDAGAVHLGQPFFHVCQREGFGAMAHRSIDKDANGCWPYAVLVENFSLYLLIHHTLFFKVLVVLNSLPSASPAETMLNEKAVA